MHGELAKLTVRLAAMPEDVWPRFAVAHAGSDPLPSPLMHVSAAGLLSVVATFVGSLLRPGWTSAGVVLHTLMAVVAYAGGGAAAVMFSPALLGYSTPREVELTRRYASGAVLPVVLSGAFNVFPLFPMILLLAFAGAASSAWSGWIGASAMLALEGEKRKRAAIVPAVLAVSLVLVATLVRWVVLPK